MVSNRKPGLQNGYRRPYSVFLRRLSAHEIHSIPLDKTHVENVASNGSQKSNQKVENENKKVRAPTKTRLHLQNIGQPTEMGLLNNMEVPTRLISFAKLSEKVVLTDKVCSYKLPASL